MMGEFEATELKEDEATARARFTSNYYSRGGTDPAWLAENIEPLIRIAVQEPRPPHPRPVRLKVGPQPKSEPLPWGKQLELERELAHV